MFWKKCYHLVHDKQYIKTDYRHAILNNVLSKIIFMIDIIES